nr:MAG TPA: hypothetical protein [Caudoviricetes sp.]
MPLRLGNITFLGLYSCICSIKLKAFFLVIVLKVW